MRIHDLTEDNSDYLEGLDSAIEDYYNESKLVPWSAFTEDDAWEFSKRYSRHGYDPESIMERLEAHGVIIEDEDDRAMHNRRASRRHRLSQAQRAINQTRQGPKVKWFVPQ